MSQNFFQGLLSGVTFGMFNWNQNGLTLKDPVTGTGNILAKFKDAVLNDYDKGVWIGKRQLEGFGFSSYATEVYNKNFQHYAVMIDGTAYHIKVSSKNNERIKIIELDQDYDNFEWFYKGKAERSISSIQRFIEKVNAAKIKYSLTMSNCQDVAKAIQFYALGQYSQEKAMRMILPDIIKLNQAFQMVAQIKAFYLPF